LRAGAPEFVVTPAPADEPVAPAATTPPPDGDEGSMTRINLRLSEQLKAAVEEAAGRERLSVNAWLVRAAAAALQGDRAARPRGGRAGQAYTGWVR
jgi:hypothetical protein